MEIDYEAIRNKTLSYSSLKQFKKSPEHFMQYMLKKMEPTPAMIFGTLLDKMILTPDTWQESFTVMPVFDKRTTVGKIGYAEFVKENAGKTFIAEDDVVTAEFITEKVFKNAAAKELLDRIDRTQDMISYTDNKTGLKLRGFLDGKGDGFIMDLKSCQSADPDLFIKQAINLDYTLQAGVYLEAAARTFFEFPEYYFLCVETSAPYGISVCRASDDFIKLGKKDLRTQLDRFKYCLDNELFHQSYEFRNLFGPNILDLPGWAKKGLD